jgi:deoxyribodipyrimidine photo-lyase
MHASPPTIHASVTFEGSLCSCLIESRKPDPLSQCPAGRTLPTVPDIRIRPVNKAPVNPNGDFVLYWMIAARRVESNFGLQRAVERSTELARPLVVLEALRCGYPLASDRLHRFIMDGMIDNRDRLQGKPVLYYPYLERTHGEGKRLLRALAEQACSIVTDDYPAFFLPRMVEAAGKLVPVRLEAVDSNGILPMAAADRVFLTAFSFRRFLQGQLKEHLGSVPKKDPFARASLPPPPGLSKKLMKRWPPATEALLHADSRGLRAFAIDHRVEPSPIRGGAAEASAALTRFLRARLERYAEEGNHPDSEVTSGLSPYLHFGHISSHEIFSRLARHEKWSPRNLANKATGGRSGWWRMSVGAERFLDQLITWRELGYNMCSKRPDYAEFDSLPEWARETLLKHARDPRPQIYSLAEFEAARTHDPLWNAAQRQLLREGRIHNYLRMVWGKKILEWSPSPRQALSIMIELNDKYALDGRDPNSYSGIFWTLGRYDRPWAPERPIFGKVRYMSSRNTERKLRLRNYLSQYG